MKADLQTREMNQKTPLFQSYIDYRDGVNPIDNRTTQRQALKSYQNFFEGLQQQNRLVRTEESSNCKRFVALYEEIGRQLSHSYERLLNQQNDRKTRDLLEARLRILHYFEGGLFVLAYNAVEAGFSDLDILGINQSCEMQNPEKWQSQINNTHHETVVLNDLVLGRRGMADPIEPSGNLLAYDRELRKKQSIKKWSFIAGETVAAIVLWEKNIYPKARLLLNRGPWPLTLKIASFGMYMASWSIADQVLRQHIDYLKDPVDLEKMESLHSWERLISAGEEFVKTDFEVPDLYYAYLLKIEKEDRDKVLKFLDSNQSVLVEAEENYGSIDIALTKFKEASGL
jgi:hypothetical protein